MPQAPQQQDPMIRDLGLDNNARIVVPKEINKQNVRGTGLDRRAATALLGTALGGFAGYALGGTWGSALGGAAAGGLGGYAKSRFIDEPDRIRQYGEERDAMLQSNMQFEDKARTTANQLEQWYDTLYGLRDYEAASRLRNEWENAKNLPDMKSVESLVKRWQDYVTGQKESYQRDTLDDTFGNTKQYIQDQSIADGGGVTDRQMALLGIRQNKLYGPKSVGEQLMVDTSQDKPVLQAGTEAQARPILTTESQRRLAQAFRTPTPEQIQNERVSAIGVKQAPANLNLTKTQVVENASKNAVTTDPGVQEALRQEALLQPQSVLAEMFAKKMNANANMVGSQASALRAALERQIYLDQINGVRVGGRGSGKPKGGVQVPTPTRAPSGTGINFVRGKDGVYTLGKAGAGAAPPPKGNIIVKLGNSTYIKTPDNSYLPVGAK